jgi:NADPH-dependent ferric siderophore reductase
VDDTFVWAGGEANALKTIRVAERDHHEPIDEA